MKRVLSLCFLLTVNFNQASVLSVNIDDSLNSYNLTAVNCSITAHPLVYEEANHYGGMTEAERYDAFLFYYESCKENDNLLDPVYL